jgi:hypothetical protein
MPNDKRFAIRKPLDRPPQIFADGLAEERARRNAVGVGEQGHGVTRVLAAWY